MELKDVLQMSLLTGGQGRNGSGVTGSADLLAFIYSIIFTFIQIILISSIKNVEVIVDKGMQSFTRFIERETSAKITELENSTKEALGIDLNAKESDPRVYKKNKIHDKYTVSMSYIETDKKNQRGVDKDKDYMYLQAILHHFGKLYNIPYLHVCTDKVVPKLIGHPFEIADDINCVIKSIYIDRETNQLTECSIDLYSTTKTSSEILSFIAKLYEVYDSDKSKTLDNSIFIFDVVETQVNKMLDPRGMPGGPSADPRRQREIEIQSQRPHLSFEKSVFKSNRNFDNVHGAAAAKIYQRLQFFINNQTWYAKKGLPYHLTFLLEGAPGLGKTTTIKATVSTLKRHIINVNCSAIKTKLQFVNLFTSEYLTVMTNGVPEQIKVPIENRVYVLEEVDAFGDIVLDRAFKSSSYAGSASSAAIPGELQLGDILTIFDGNNECPGRTVIMTSNYPERLDRALLRGGRIDVIAHFEFPKADEIIKYLEFFFEAPVGKDMIDKFKTYSKEKWMLSYADLAQLCFSHSVTDPDLFEILLNRNKEKRALYSESSGISENGSDRGEQVPEGGYSDDEAEKEDEEKEENDSTSTRTGRLIVNNDGQQLIEQKKEDEITNNTNVTMNKSTGELAQDVYVKRDPSLVSQCQQERFIDDLLYPDPRNKEPPPERRRRENEEKKRAEEKRRKFDDYGTKLMQHSPVSIDHDDQNLHKDLLDKSPLFKEGRTLPSEPIKAIQDRLDNSPLFGGDGSGFSHIPVPINDRNIRSKESHLQYLQETEVNHSPLFGGGNCYSSSSDGPTPFGSGSNGLASLAFSPPQRKDVPIY